MPDDRYFQPSSATMNTTLPSSSSFAMRIATRAMAPEETPTNSRSSSSSLRVHTIASLLVTNILRSSSDRSMIGGMKPSSRDRRPCTRSPLSRLALHRLGRDDLDALAERLLQALAVAHQRPARAQPGHERGDLVQLFED